MSDKITHCVEEEYSFALSYLWRRSAGWCPLLIYFRGPGGVPFFITPFLTLAGLWRFARPPRRLTDFGSSSLQRSVVIRTSCHLGSYGMGGPGFVGLRLRPQSGNSLWIVFTLWGAAGWLTLDDALLEDGYFPDERSDPSRSFLPLATLVGAQLHTFAITPDAAEFTFTHHGTTQLLRLQRDSNHLPVHRGSQQPKILSPSEDLRNAIIVSQRANLWLTN